MSNTFLMYTADGAVYEIAEKTHLLRSSNFFIKVKNKQYGIVGFSKFDPSSIKGKTDAFRNIQKTKSLLSRAKGLFVVYCEKKIYRELLHANEKSLTIAELPYDKLYGLKSKILKIIKK